MGEQNRAQYPANKPISRKHYESNIQKQYLAFYMNGNMKQMGNSIATTLGVVNNNSDAAAPVQRGRWKWGIGIEQIEQG